MTKIFIIPGYQNSLGKHWQSIWEHKFHFEKIQQNDWNYPICQEWIDNIQSYIKQQNSSDIILVGHSLGCIAIVNWAKQTSLKIKGALLVALPEPKNSMFPKQAIGFDKINNSRLNFKSILVASTDDPYSSIEHAKKFANLWGSEFINIGDKGHINMDSNLGDWQEGIHLINTL